MKKLLLLFVVLGCLSASAQTYTYIGQRYEWLAGLFRALGLPTGDSAQFQVGQRIRQGAVYVDTVNTSGSPVGFYIYRDPTGGNNPYWVLQSAAEICGNRLLTPWNVSWQGTGFNFTVHGGQPSGQGSYQIGCSFYLEDSATVPLNPSDPDLDRIDVIYLDATGIHVREGDLAAPGTAQKPSLTLDEIELTFITVGAGTTQPTLTQLLVYDENIESTVTTTGATVDPNNLTNVFVGLKSVNVTNVNHNDLIHFDKLPGATTWAVLGYDALVIGVKLKPTMPINTSCNIAVSLVGSGGVEVIVPVTKTNNSTYQQISVPLSAFGNLTNTNIGRVNFRYLFPTAPLNVYVGFYLDYIYFIDGLTQPAATPATFTLTAMPGITVNPTNTQQSPGGWTLTNQLAAAGQYYTKEGWVTLPSFLQSIGTLDGQAKSPDGASVLGNELFMQLADTIHAGLLSPDLYRKISRNDSVTNGTPGDTLLVKVNDSLLLIKSLIAGLNITFDVGADSIVINSSGGGGPTLTQGEGIALSGDSIHLGGLVQAPSLFIESRAINTMREIMHWTNGTPPEIGGPIWQHSDRPYSPYQFISADTLTANSVDPPTAVMPVSGIFARRTMYYNPGIFTTQKVYGHYLGKTVDWADSMRFRTEGGDYNQAVIAEHRLMPRGTGAQRTGIHGTGNNNNPYYGVPAFLSNTILANSGGVADGSTSTIHTYGWLVGVSSYLVAGALDTVERFSFFQTNNLGSASTRLKKLYGLDFQHSLTAPATDSAFGLWDQYGYRHYLRGKTVFGTSTGTVHPWTSTDQLKVIGNVNITDSLHLGKAHNLGATIGTRFMVRRTSDGAVMEVDPSLVTGGGSSAHEIVYINAPYTVADGVTHVQVLTFTTTGTDITLPDASLWPGRQIIVSSADASADLVHAAGAINDGEGNDLTSITANATWSFVSDGTDWNQTRLSWHDPYVASTGTGSSIIEPNPYYQPNNHRGIQRFKRFEGLGGITVTDDDLAVYIDGTGLGGGGVTSVDPWSTTSTANAMSITGTAIKLHAASAANPGGIRVGAGLAIDGSGILSVTGTVGALWNGLFGGTARYPGNATLVGGVSDPVQIVSENTAPGATVTMPALAGNGNHAYFFKNEGTDDLTITRAGSDQFYTTSLVTSFVIPIGESRLVMSSGAFWHVHGLPPTSSGLTQEQVEDIVGTLFGTDNGDIDFTYNDGTPDIAAQIKAGAVGNTEVAAGIDAVKIADGSVTNTEFQHINTLTGNVQTALDGKANTALSNLASVAVNTTIESDADNTDDLGSVTRSWKDIYTRTTKYDGPTSGTITVESGPIGQVLLGTNLDAQGNIPIEYDIYVRSDETLSASNADQPLFTNTAHDVIAVLANTTYEFEGAFDLTHGATSHDVQFGMLPTTATITIIRGTAILWVTAVGTQTASQTTTRLNSTATTPLNAAGANATESFTVKGWFTVGATGGTIQPTLQFSSNPTGTVLLKAGSEFHLKVKGNNTFTERGPFQ